MATDMCNLFYRLASGRASGSQKLNCRKRRGAGLYLSTATCKIYITFVICLFCVCVVEQSYLYSPLDSHNTL